MKIRVAIPIILAAACLAPGAQALPPCTTTCHPAGIWFWNRQNAEYELLVTGIDLSGRHFDVANANCYGIGTHIWRSKGPEFQKFHCSIKPVDADGTTYGNYGISVYVRGRYAWTWGA